MANGADSDETPHQSEWRKIKKMSIEYDAQAALGPQKREGPYHQPWTAPGATGTGGVVGSPFIVKDSGKRMEFSSGSVRDTSEGKIKWSRITFGPMLRRWAQHLTTAEAKYPDIAPGVPNFSLIETEEELIRYKESAFRHFMSWFDGEIDEDHASALFFNVNGVEMIKLKQRVPVGTQKY